MGQEIERKFLLQDDSWRRDVRRSISMRQGYLVGNPASSVRIRVEDEHAFINIKSATLGIQRQEFEYAIPPGDAESMLNAFCAGAQLTKVRHLCFFGRHTWEIDEFAGENAGLIVAEIELSAVDEQFDRPPWLGEEVSEDARYYNVCLIERPYTRW